MSRELLKRIALPGGPLFGLLCYFAMTTIELAQPAAMVAGVTVLCAIWWVFEPVPIPVTSIIPFGLFPLLEILTPAQIAGAYGSPLILLLLGGFILSTAMEHSGAHRHIAIKLVHLFGAHKLRNVVFGFMAAASILSMWISNTATTLMLLPVALAVLQHYDNPRFAISLLLGICYAASIGGMGTPIGTPPNLIFMKVYEDTIGETISFLDWMLWALPVVIILVPIAAWVLTRKLPTGAALELPPKQKWSTQQKRVMAVFALTAVLWVTRTEPFGGWKSWFGLEYANDASVALLSVVLMFCVSDGKGGRLLTWETVNKIPWGMLLLFAGGIALARAFNESGLADLIAAQLSSLAGLPILLMVLAICLGVTFMTEMTSNTATTALLMPILAAAASAAKIDPLLLMVPAAMSASCAFMLPVATAPNAIVFSSSKVRIDDMLRFGLRLNIIGAIVIASIMVVIL
jgi:sodium-dependent dicarboxylate transporter 2/3/5